MKKPLQLLASFAIAFTCLQVNASLETTYHSNDMQEINSVSLLNNAGLLNDVEQVVSEAADINNGSTDNRQLHLASYCVYIDPPGFWFCF